MRLKLNNVYGTVDGEVNHRGIGCPTLMVRFQGCNLRCSWCDTSYSQSFEDGYFSSIDLLAEEILGRPVDKVTITGGEPLLQLASVDVLLCLLLRNKRKIDISIETNGTIMWFPTWVESDFVGLIVDFKLPSSGYDGADFPTYPDWYREKLNRNSFIKFVIQNKEDYGYAKSIMKELSTTKARFAFSPVLKHLRPSLLASWMSNDELQAHLNIQMHKIIWPEELFPDRRDI